MPKIQRCLKDKMLEHKDHLPVLQLREAAALSGCHSHILSRQYPETHEEEEEEAGWLLPLPFSASYNTLTAVRLA